MLDPTPSRPLTPALALTTALALILSLPLALAGASAGSAADGVAPAQPDARARTRGSTFQLATFNQLGSQHTRHSSRYRSGTSRAHTTARVIKDHGTDLVALQEVQRDQLRVLHRNLGAYGIWPSTSLGNQGVRLQLAWRKKRLRYLGHGTLTTSFARQKRPIPYLHLRDRRSGTKFFVINVHNSPNRLEGERDRATRKELRLVRRLRSSGQPVFVMGDTNEHREFFCKAGRATGLNAANGGINTKRRCRTPRHNIIDWILGDGRIDFRGYRQDRGRRVRRASDHHYVQANVRVARRVR